MLVLCNNRSRRSTSDEIRGRHGVFLQPVLAEQAHQGFFGVVFAVLHCPHVDEVLRDGFRVLHHRIVDLPLGSLAAGILGSGHQKLDGNLHGDFEVLRGTLGGILCHVQLTV